MRIRITPAYAGKSGAKNVGNRPSKDHPRLCGEKLILMLLGNLRKGSPPPMRGKGKPCRKPCTCQWITPAYAGKSQSTPRRIRCQGDHPRLCGEKTLIFLLCHTCLGSPPPMRGKGIFVLACDLNYRITPAYAGKSNSKAF